LVGAAASWLISRRVTRPLAALTGASEAIASGDYEARVRLEGHDEMVRLATAFNRMGAEVAETRQQLETQAQAAGKARALAESASRAKSDFLAVMSHELRTPLNAIAGYTELLLLGLRGPLTEAQRRDLERIRANEQHLLGLIGAVLDLSRIESGRVAYELETVVVDPFLRELDALVVPQAHAKSLALEYTGSRPDLRVVADREKLRQIMLNLISNAIRHTPAGGRVTLAAEANGDNSVTLSVRDTGEGIPSEARERIFEPFVQLDRSLTQSREGVGLGLAISRDLARGMGGDLTVESEPRMGSTFLLKLRRATQPAMV
jgi:signal transduction histidine kinase